MAEVLQAAIPTSQVLAWTDLDSISPVVSPAPSVLLLMVPRDTETESVLTTVAAARRPFSGARVMLIGPELSEITTRQAMAAGVYGIVPRTDSLKVVIAAARLVMVGGTYFPAHPALDLRPSDEATEHDGSRQRLSDIFVAGSRSGDFGDCSADPAPPSSGLRLTPREADVLAALQQGLPNKLIAHQLNLSENTIKIHIQHIMRKLNASNRTQAVLISKES
jgi:DNA-binding NarL/FixJ family response regulator